MNKNATWHCACVIAWQFWNAPSGEISLLRRLQARRCGQTGGRLWKSAGLTSNGSTLPLRTTASGGNCLRGDIQYSVTNHEQIAIPVQTQHSD
jgi:hypothetical protein